MICRGEKKEERRKGHFSIKCECMHAQLHLFVTLWTVACRGPLSTRFSRQEYWRGLPFPLSGDIPNPGIEPRSPALQADSLPLNHQESPL